jgi:N-acetylmuramoyl-L-alanine amidase
MNQKRTILIWLVVIIVGCWAFGGRPVCAQNGPVKLVVVDAAHGGSDLGVKIADKVHEKDLTLKLALLVQKELDKGGQLQVILTRDKDVAISTEDRAKKIMQTKPRLMVSIHINSGMYKAAKGFEIYFPGFKSVKVSKDESTAIINDMAKNKSLNESVRLAQNIQKQLELVFPKESRGLREAPLALLDGLSIPAVVVEIGFASNVEDRKKITEERYQQDIAKALSKGIRESL